MLTHKKKTGCFKLQGEGCYNFIKRRKLLIYNKIIIEQFKKVILKKKKPFIDIVAQAVLFIGN